MGEALVKRVELRIGDDLYVTEKVDGEWKTTHSIKLEKWKTTHFIKNGEHGEHGEQGEQGNQQV